MSFEQIIPRKIVGTKETKFAIRHSKKGYKTAYIFIGEDHKNIFEKTDRVKIYFDTENKNRIMVSKAEKGEPYFKLCKYKNSHY